MLLWPYMCCSIKLHLWKFARSYSQAVCIAWLIVQVCIILCNYLQSVCGATCWVWLPPYHNFSFACVTSSYAGIAVQQDFIMLAGFISTLWFIITYVLFIILKYFYLTFLFWKDPFLQFVHHEQCIHHKIRDERRFFYDPLAVA